MKAMTLFLALALAGGALGQTASGATGRCTWSDPVERTTVTTMGVIYDADNRAVWRPECISCFKQSLAVHSFVVPCRFYKGRRMFDAGVLEFALCSDCECKITRDGKPWPWSVPATKEATK